MPGFFDEIRDSPLPTENPLSGLYVPQQGRNPFAQFDVMQPGNPLGKWMDLPAVTPAASGGGIGAPMTPGSDPSASAGMGGLGKWMTPPVAPAPQGAGNTPSPPPTSAQPNPFAQFGPPSPAMRMMPQGAEPSSDGLLMHAPPSGLLNVIRSLTPQQQALVLSMPRKEGMELLQKLIVQDETFDAPTMMKDPATGRMVAVRYGNRGSERQLAGGLLPAKVGETPWWASDPQSGQLDVQHAGAVEGAKATAGLPAKLAVAAAGAARNHVNVNTYQEGEAAKRIGQYYGDLYGTIQNTGMKATSSNANVQRLGQLLDQVNTGKFAGTTQQFKQAAKGLGVDLEKMGIRDDVAPAEAAMALSRQMALQLRDPASGAGMPGALSDSDRRFLESMVPGIEQTPEGRRMIMAATKKVNDRNIAVARMANDYLRRSSGRFDQNFMAGLQDYAEKNPLFDDKDMATAEKVRLPRAATAADVARLPSGARFVDPAGAVRVKP